MTNEKTEKIKYYIVYEIDYEDDYKHRYDSGVYPEIVGLYKTQKMAEDKVLELKVKFILEHMGNTEKYTKKRFNNVKENYDKYKKGDMTGKTNIEDIYERYTTGEYVEKTKEIYIEEIKLKEKVKEYEIGTYEDEDTTDPLADTTEEDESEEESEQEESEENDEEQDDEEQEEEDEEEQEEQEEISEEELRTEIKEFKDADCCITYDIKDGEIILSKKNFKQLIDIVNMNNKRIKENETSPELEKIYLIKRISKEEEEHELLKEAMYELVKPK